MYDVPTPIWLTPLVWFLRLAKYVGLQKAVVFQVRNRAHIGLLTRLHLQAVHATRRLIVSEISRDQKNALSYEKIQNVADAYRDVMADILEVENKELHCTIKIFSEEIAQNQAEQCIYTLARSTDIDNYWGVRQLLTGSGHTHKVGENSSFAALIGVSDGEKDWKPDEYNCFICNSMGKLTNYVSSGAWDGHYCCTAVFPIRFESAIDSNPTVCGFITFDAKKDVFGGGCDIYKCGDPATYREKASLLSYYHVGGILADALVPFMLLYKNNDQGGH